MAAEGLLKNELVLVIERPSFKELEVFFFSFWKEKKFNQNNKKKETKMKRKKQ